MANQEHLDILKQGVEVWNRWRKEHIDKPILHFDDFAHADLSDEYPSSAQLSKTDLSGAVLREVELI